MPLSCKVFGVGIWLLKPNMQSILNCVLYKYTDKNFKTLTLYKPNNSY